MIQSGIGEEEPHVQMFYFAISVVGGFFVIAIPWSGLLLMLGKRQRPDNPNSLNQPIKK